MPRTHTTVTILAITALFGSGDAAPVIRRRHTKMLATVTPFAEDFFHEGRARHQCHIKPDDASQLPFQAACHTMAISAHDTRHMEISLRADTVDDDEPVVVNFSPVDSGSALDVTADDSARRRSRDVSGDGHCVLPGGDGNSCVGRTILHVRLQFDDDGPDCKTLFDLVVNCP